GVRRRPAGVAGEGERVELARHVAARGRGGVVTPGAAHVVVLLDHHVVGLTRLGELEGGAEPSEAGPDDQVVDVRREGRGGWCGHGVTLSAPSPPWWVAPRGSHRRSGREKGVVHNQNVGDYPAVSRWSGRRR